LDEGSGGRAPDTKRSSRGPPNVMNANEVRFYPRSGKVFFRGIGLVTRLGEPLDYWEGED
jgi:hypothetical protein